MRLPHTGHTPIVMGRSQPWRLSGLVEMRGPRHLFRGQGEAITVAELLEDAVERGEGVRLNWPVDDLDFSPIRADELGQYPTVILPMPHGVQDGQD